MENQSRHPLADNFFYRFYNSNVNDGSAIDSVPDVLYTYVMREIVMYKKKEHKAKLRYMQFCLVLLRNIKQAFPDLDEALMSSLSKK